MKLTFLGATRTVTGSKYLLETDEGEKFLIDCGLFQGPKELRLRNWEPLPLPAKEIKNIILTHAHLDHSGYIPLLVKQGFIGKIICSPATRDLCSILLPDSGHLQEEEARLANKHGYSKHKPALPLYTQQDAEQSLSFFQTLEYNHPIKLREQLEITLVPAGHILGASSVLIKYKNKTILFSGDLGRYHHPVMYPPAELNGADYVIVESTYGNRLHEKTKPIDSIGNIINATVRRKGVILIPAFAVGRTQTLLLDIYKLKKSHRIPDLPIFLDSPLATDATHIYTRYTHEHRMTEKQCKEVCGSVRYVNSTEDSKALDKRTDSFILLSASGMATGGRILHHLKRFAPEPRNTILFTGYQAMETRGYRITHGETSVKMLGQMVPIRAKVEILNNASAHADSEEILLWLSKFKITPQKVFVTHGEPESSESLAEKIRTHFGWNCVVPEYLDTEEIKCFSST